MGCLSSKLETKEEHQRDQNLLKLTLKDTHQFSFDGLIAKAKVVDVCVENTLQHYGRHTEKAENR